MTKEEFDALGIKQGDLIFITPKNKLKIWGCGFFVHFIKDRKSHCLYISSRKNNHGFKKIKYPFIGDDFCGTLRQIQSIEILKKDFWK